MSKSNLSPKDFSALNMSFQLACAIIIPLLIFVLLGLFIDQHFHTTPIFIFIGLILAIIISSVSVYKIVLPYLTVSKKSKQTLKK